MDTKTEIPKTTEEAGLSPIGSGSATVHVKPLWPLGIFFCLSAASAWTVWLWPINRPGWFTLFIFGWELKIPFFLTKLVVGNCLPGILAVIWVLFEGKAQFRRMLSTLTKWKTSLMWYILSIVLPCGVSLVALDAVLFYFPTEHSFPPPVQFLKALLFTLPFGPLWEELAWRAFALRKLEYRYSRLVSALLLGVYWAVWHIPLWLVQLNRVPVNKISYLLVGSITLVAWSVIWAYLYHRSSESLPVVILLHATYGAATTQAALVVPQLDMYVIYVSAVLSICFALAFGRALRRNEGCEPSPD
jgi:membrane protease YdiL (CAAX protease family)